MCDVVDEIAFSKVNCDFTIRRSLLEDSERHKQKQFIEEFAQFVVKGFCLGGS